MPAKARGFARHRLRLPSCVRQVQQIGHGDRVLVRFQVKIGIPLFDLE